MIPPLRRRTPVTRSQLLLRTDVINAVIGSGPVRLWLTFDKTESGTVVTLWWGDPLNLTDGSMYCHSTNGTRAMWEYLGGMLDGKAWFRGVDEEYCTSAGLTPVGGPIRTGSGEISQISS